MTDASVIIVNYNGEPYLEGLLRSLERQTHPCFEILVVDNGSTDGSADLVQGSFPQVRWIDAGKNLGFSGGNNLGIRKSRGDYVALVNNDTVVDPQWLERLVEEARTDLSIGAVGSKILFARPFVPVTLEVSTFQPARSGHGGDTRKLGVFFGLDSRFESCSYKKPIFKSGFYGPELVEGEAGRWSQGQAQVFLPVNSLTEPDRLVLRVWGRALLEPRRLRVRIGDADLGAFEIGPGWREHRLTLPSNVLQRTGFDVINNAGSFLDDDGQAGDRGIFEPDRGQYDRTEDVTALCGCSMLLPRPVLHDVGLFDESYFMYFEDTELSWRIREAGYRLRYQPGSLVRHYHASTSVEWSPLFNFLVTRNRILMLTRHASPRHAIRAYAEELFRLGKLLATRRSLRDQQVRTRLKVQLSLLWQGPRALLRRILP